MTDYFTQAKEEFEKKIPDISSRDFSKMANKIRKVLSKKESGFLLFIRSLKIMILGDWFTPQKKKILFDIKQLLLKNGLYAKTIDEYYNVRKGSGLSQSQLLDTCCTLHQLIVFIDGDGKGTLIDQNCLCQWYWFQGKVIFFIGEGKFNELKDKPSEYIKNFPTIITYRGNELKEKVLVYSRFRIYRLGEIIKQQESMRKGPYGPKYKSWKIRKKIFRRKKY